MHKIYIRLHIIDILWMNGLIYEHNNWSILISEGKKNLRIINGICSILSKLIKIILLYSRIQLWMLLWCFIITNNKNVMWNILLIAVHDIFRLYIEVVILHISGFFAIILKCNKRKCIIIRTWYKKFSLYGYHRLSNPES